MEAAQKPLLLLFVLLAGMSSAVASDAADWLCSYYSDSASCVSKASVSEIADNKNALVVTLTVDEVYLAKLKRINDEVVEEWLALHCPLPLAAHARHIGNRDIILLPTSKNHPLKLSCKTVESRRQQ